MSSGPDVTAILRALSACPTAPFHEAYVARQIVAFCRDSGIDVSADPFGNLLATVPPVPSDPGAAPEQSHPIAFCAHMDHPSLEVVSADPLRVRVRGGLRWPDHPVALRFITESGEIRGRALAKHALDGELDIACEAEGLVPEDAFAVLDVDDYREDGDLLHGRAMDDLGGCAAILAALARCRARGVAGDIAGVFTRAEEVGLVGATLICEMRALPQDAIVVSLETSRALTGAELGDGPVIRVGDRSTAFHPSGDALLRHAAERLTTIRPELKIQRQLMSGGTCEGTAFMLAGYVTTGVALPLGNYHNAAPGGGLEAEFIHRRDLETCVDLLVAAAEEAARPPSPDPLYDSLRTRARGFAERLQETARAFAP
jgi:putative aminopeptidase FrvX